jgi:hypothetical protein
VKGPAPGLWAAEPRIGVQLGSLALRLSLAPCTPVGSVWAVPMHNATAQPLLDSY